jgi:NADH dehydrogenase [ubiquinone] 1 alpha subcomplex assembly factor 1
MLMELQETATLSLFDSSMPWNEWYSADDGLMGGVSQSRMVEESDRVGIFLGRVSLEQQGGFASVRSPEFRITRPNTHGLRLQVRGDGHIYTACLHTPGLQPGTSYRCRFQPPAYEWQTIDLPFDDFVLMRFGQRVGVMPVNPERIRSLSFMIADRQEGAFALEVGSIMAYAAG